MNQENIGNVKEVVVDKQELLNIIKENKAKHDALLEISIAGYWAASKDQIVKKVEEFKIYEKALSSDFQHSTDFLIKKIENKEKVDNYSYIPIPNASFSYSVDLKYPESHSQDYYKAIRSIELSVYDKIKLTEQEFNQYVLNDWSWKASFVRSNSLYLYSGMAYNTGCFSSSIACSGMSIL